MARSIRVRLDDEAEAALALVRAGNGSSDSGVSAGRLDAAEVVAVDEALRRVLGL